MEKENPGNLPKIEDYFTHTEDFTIVKVRHQEWFEFQLNKTQANIVEKLFISFEKGIQWTSSDKLIKNYSREKTIQKIFKDCGDWKALIKVSEKRKGFYALNILLHPQMFIDGNIVFEDQMSKLHKKKAD